MTTTPAAPPQSSTIEAFQRAQTCSRFTAVLLVGSVSGILVGAAALAWGGGTVPIVGIGLSVVALVVAMRLGVHANDRHLELMQKLQRAKDVLDAGWALGVTPETAKRVRQEARGCLGFAGP